MGADYHYFRFFICNIAHLLSSECQKILEDYFSLYLCAGDDKEMTGGCVWPLLSFTFSALLEKFFGSVRAARKAKFQTDLQIKYHILYGFVVHLLSGVVWGTEHEHVPPQPQSLLSFPLFHTLTFRLIFRICPLGAGIVTSCYSFLWWSLILSLLRFLPLLLFLYGFWVFCDSIQSSLPACPVFCTGHVL